MSSTSVIPLLQNWEVFLENHPAGSLQDFAQWLLKKKQEANSKSATQKAMPRKQALDNTAQATLLISRLSRLMSMLFKPILQQLGFNKGHEFGVLVQVAVMEEPNKKELANQVLLEISTTVEITKRLAQKGLIQEKEDQNDRRSSRLSLTEKGENLLKDGYKKMETIYTDYLSCLDKQEQDKLVELLNKLNNYHSQKFRQQQL